MCSSESRLNSISEEGLDLFHRTDLAAAIALTTTEPFATLVLRLY